MSKIGRMPITIKEGVTVVTDAQKVTVTGSKGTQMYTFPKGIAVLVADGKVTVSQEAGEDRAMFGLTRATIAQMVKGVSEGFEKKLELSGVGYRAQTSGTELTLSVGFSHQVKIKATGDIKFVVTDNIITISGSNSTLVGDMAAQIRAIRKPEPYKGKGIKYVGERIRRKAGKAAKAVGGK